MKYTITYTESYIKKARKFFKKHPELLGQYQKTLELLEINPTHPSLRMHALKGNLSGVYFVSINMSYRLSCEFIIREKEIIPLDIGDHDHVY